jgi:hypothetical protein
MDTGEGDAMTDFKAIKRRIVHAVQRRVVNPVGRNCR